MSEMIEKVAEAIALAGNGGTWDDWYNEDQKEFHRSRARAAIVAMREPTKAMADEPTWYDGPYAQFTPSDAREVWEQMIDVALGITSESVQKC